MENKGEQTNTMIIIFSVTRGWGAEIENGKEEEVEVRPTVLNGKLKEDSIQKSTFNLKPSC